MDSNWNPRAFLNRIDLVGLAIVVTAVLVRVVLIDIKPPHFDEGINGWFVDQMRGTGFYKYDPSNYHGPFHFYTLFLSLSLFGRNLFALRLPAIISSVLSVWMTLRFDTIFSKTVCRLAALAMALSPAFVFYGRYSIHESWLLLFLLITTWGILTLWKEGSRAGLWAAGLGVTGMILTKETYIIHAGCLLLAFGTLKLYEMAVPSEPQPPVKARWNIADVGWVTAVSIWAILLFYSGFFLNNEGVKGLLSTFQEWIKTGNKGNGHEKPFEYWLRLITQFEWPALLGLALSTRYLWKSNRYLRYLAIYGSGCLLAYSIIKYKTPWCLIVILWPFYFTLAGVVEEAWKSPFKALRWACIPAAAAAVLFSTYQMADVNFRRFTDESHEYVYVQTYNDVRKITEPLEILAKRDPQNYHLRGVLLMDSQFPLPWLLGDFTGLLYYQKDNRPPQFDAAMLLVDKDRIPEVERHLRDRYFSEDVRIRNAMAPARLYLRETEFRPLFPDREPNTLPVEFPEGEDVEIRRASPARSSDL